MRWFITVCGVDELSLQYEEKDIGGFFSAALFSPLEGVMCLQ